jgi:hypothetical protein
MQKDIGPRCCRKEKSPIFCHRKQRRKEEAPKTNYFDNVFFYTRIASLLIFLKI